VDAEGTQRAAVKRRRSSGRSRSPDQGADEPLTSQNIGAGDGNRTRTISLGNQQIGAPDRLDLQIRCTASDRYGPCDTRINGPPMARGPTASGMDRARPGLTPIRQRDHLHIAAGAADGDRRSVTQVAWTHSHPACASMQVS
jgi:hypothetical protein